MSTLGNQTAAWRGFSTVAFTGGRYGAMNPYPQKPSYKIRQILNGWDDGCWYPDKAPIIMAPSSGTPSDVVLISELAMAGNVVIGPGTTGGAYIEIGGFSVADQLVLSVIDGTYAAWSRWATDDHNGGRSWTCGVSMTTDNGTILRYLDDPGYSATHYFSTAAAAHAYAVTQPAGIFSGSTYYRLNFDDYAVNENRGGLSLRVSRRGAFLQAINPAHVLYYSRTNQEMGRELASSINSASLQAAADKLFSEGFGICPKWDPASETVEDFEKRICKLIGGSFSRSLEDGQWYLDLARGDYVLADLPILTDDDILDFKEQPSLLDNAINSVSVRYFDPEKKETIVTAPVRALGLVASFGTIHQTNDYPEIPTADLAARVALRDLLTTATPTRAFDLVTNRTPYNWRPNQYFRLQAPKRGIADMVCILGENQTGTLKSGAIRLKATQDIYGLPSASFVQVESGVDTRPSQIPTVIPLQRVFEAPYVEVAGALSRADLAALPSDIGYVMGAASTPATDIDYALMVSAAGGDYVEVARGDWCAVATINETAAPGDTAFTLANGSRLAAVEVGMAALWDDEIVRVDAIAATALTLTLGRGCADTVAAESHAGGSRVWFYDTAAARGTAEYAAAEVIAVKLLSNTGSQRLPLASATALSLTFASRQYRPYPPGQFRVNGLVSPTDVIGAVTLTGVHRDRVQQADQLVDGEMAAIGPEAGTTYTARYYINGALVHTDSGLSTPSSTYTPTAGGIMRVEFEAVRDALASFQMHVREFAVGAVLQAEDGTLISTEDVQSILMG
ncbi:hypothetical protein PY254_10665 [Rhodanobacter sp. AS-Z3]|uniref:hypothetical protein n=1 Tax=Rhodanobacter sp. AS-Z3 TaxID=3031330 RepID=UPI00247AE47F|nr:hypothetical protein [Rhodanobacter sp. AS-Z3]WEN16868.1 hypothetical protein PY254_10665 [Rhodanobacter sp. AS-Z3]